jgi:hypothetical protein
MRIKRKCIGATGRSGKLGVGSVAVHKPVRYAGEKAAYGKRNGVGVGERFDLIQQYWGSILRSLQGTIDIGDDRTPCGQKFRFAWSTVGCTRISLGMNTFVHIS